jgi:hypothetical protein
MYLQSNTIDPIMLTTTTLLQQRSCQQHHLTTVIPTTIDVTNFSRLNVDDIKA